MPVVSSRAPAKRADVIGTLRRNPQYARIYLAQLISFAGDWFLFVALQGLALQLTGSASIAGLLFTVQMIPPALVSPIAGAVVDRVDRRMVMLVSDVVRAVLALGFLFVDSRGTLVIAFACTAAIAVMTSFFEPAAGAILPNVVRDEDLPTAIALHSSSWGSMLLIGAALGGYVSLAFGRPAAFIVNAVTFAVSAAILATVRGHYRADRPPEHHPSLVRDVRELVRFARTERRVTAMLTVKAGFGLSAGVIGLISVMSVQVFRTGDQGTGLMLSARGIGAVIGPFLFRRVFGTSDRALFVGVTTAFVVFGLGYALFGVAPTLVIASIGTCIAHVGGGAQWALSTMGLQRFSHDAIRGRVFGADYALMSIMMGISFAIAGFAADAIGPRAVAIGFSALGICWTAAWTFWTRHSWPARGITTPSESTAPDTQPHERLEI